MFKSRFIRMAVAAIGLASLTPALAAEKGTVGNPEYDYPSYPAVKYGTGQHAQLVKKGEYLAKLGDCIACHTAHGKEAKAYAGGFGIETPFGTIYTPNITSDKTTGIGNWSLADFKKAMRDGKGPSGMFHYYYPAFPYLYFNILSDDDLHALHEYFKAVPAVKQANKKDDMMWPFSMRFLQIGWRLMFFDFQKTGPYQYDHSQSQAWNRGKYLVDGLGHCSMCHTPSYTLFSKKYQLAAPIRKYYLTGGFAQGYAAPNITAAVMKTATVKDLAKVFRQDEMIGGGHIVGPMQEANHDSLKYLNDKDVAAILTYLKTVHTKPPAVKGAGKNPKGAEVYGSYCAACHGSGAGGAPKFGDATVWENLEKSKGLDTLYKNAWNGINAMPAKGTCASCTKKDLQAAVNYMIDMSKDGGAENNNGGVEVVPTAPQAKPLPANTGKNIYTTHCAVCHAKAFKNAPQVGDTKAWNKVMGQGMDIVLQHAIKGYNDMPAKGACSKCTNRELIAAVKYMAHQSKVDGKNYRLW